MLQLDTEETFDFLKIFSSYNSDQMAAQYSFSGSVRDEKNIRIFADSFVVEFTSDESVTDIGFIMEFSAELSML